MGQGDNAAVLLSNESLKQQQTDDERIASCADAPHWSPLITNIIKQLAQSKTQTQCCA